MAGQDQTIGGQLQDSLVQLAQAGENAISFQNSHDNHVIILKYIVQLFGFGAATPTSVDWDWAQKLLQGKELITIRKRLTDTLGRDRHWMSIGFEEQGKWVGRLSPLQAERRLEVNGEDQGILDSQQLLIETFGRDDIGGKLLILGTPGAGKTTALLSLAEQLVCGAIAKPRTVIPVIVELSTWGKDDQSIEDWLIEQLYDLHGGDRKFKRYETWLEHQVLLPLMDGLDELGLERQMLCTQKLKEFLRTYPHAVVCCRTKEFAQADIKLKELNGAVCLNPLSDEQIQGYWKTVEQSELWSEIQGSERLRQLLEPTEEGDPGLLRIPLFVNLAAKVKVRDPQYTFQSKQDLVQQYVEDQLSRDVREANRQKELEGRSWAYATVKNEPQRQTTQQTLSWVARQLNHENQVELLIEKMQPQWLEKKRSKRFYRLIVGLIVGLIFGLIVGLIVELIVGLIVGLIVELIVGLIVGLIFGLDTIEPVEAFKISMSREARREILRNFKQWLIVGLIVGLIFGLIFGLIGGLKQELQLRSHPNQGIKNSLQSMVWTTVFSYPLGIIFASLSVLPANIADAVTNGESIANILDIIWTTLPQFLIPGIFGALLFGFLVGGGMPVVQHYCLRFVLDRHKIAPWDLPRFLNYCVERRLLQRVGGRYRFLHRELLDFFANLAG